MFSYRNRRYYHTKFIVRKLGKKVILQFTIRQIEHHQRLERIDQLRVKIYQFISDNLFINDRQKIDERILSFMREISNDYHIIINTLLCKIQSLFHWHTLKYSQGGHIETTIIEEDDEDNNI
jgi:hypothetical protein